MLGDCADEAAFRTLHTKILCTHWATPLLRELMKAVNSQPKTHTPQTLVQTLPKDTPSHTPAPRPVQPTPLQPRSQHHSSLLAQEQNEMPGSFPAPSSIHRFQPWPYQGKNTEITRTNTCEHMLHHRSLSPSLLPPQAQNRHPTHNPLTVGGGGALSEPLS